MNVMFTNVNGSDESLCIVTEYDHPADLIIRGFRALHNTFTDAFVVRDDEMCYYLYELCCLTERQVSRLLEIAQNV